MKISTRSRYGLRIMLVLARHYGQGLVHLRQIAAEEKLSEKYLSQLILPLKGMGLVCSGQGVDGGYRLARPPAQITIREIVEPLEGGLRLLDCVRDASFCDKADACCARGVWSALENRLIDTLDQVKLSSLMKGKPMRRHPK